MGAALDISGRKFSRLKVLSRAGSNKHGASIWNCVCDCGNECVGLGYEIKIGHKRSCGCLVPESTSKLNLSHGHTAGGGRTPTYKAWRSMINRCNQPSTDAWEHYGAIGIQVCARWEESYENFLTDMGEQPKGKTIDRIRSDGDYEPSNCRWASLSQQSQNRRRPRNNTSGEKNVSWIKSIGRWRVSFCVDGKKSYFGHFDSMEAARSRAVQVRNALHGEYANHG